MRSEIKEKAQELYPISESAECYTAFLRGARYVFAVIWGDTICDYFNQWVGNKLVPIEAKEEFIEKATLWLDENLYSPKYEKGTWKESKSQFIDDFKKAMEE
jgi:hypothetical protein